MLGGLVLKVCYEKFTSKMCAGRAAARAVEVDAAEVDGLAGVGGVPLLPDDVAAAVAAAAAGRLLVKIHLRVGFGRIDASATEAPNILANLVYTLDERSYKATMRLSPT